MFAVALENVVSTDFFGGDSSKRDAYMVAIMDMISSWEGGVSNHANDTGGLTRYGVTIGAWRSKGGSDSAFHALTKDGAQQFFQQHYFGGTAIQDAHPALWPILTDISVNSGVGRPFDLMQDALYKAGYIDKPGGGVYNSNENGGRGGKQEEFTAALKEAQDRFIADHGVTALGQAIAARRMEYYAHLIAMDPSQKSFEAGWNRRGMGTAPKGDIGTYDGAIASIGGSHNGNNPNVPSGGAVAAYIAGENGRSLAAPVPTQFDEARFARGINQVFASSLATQIAALEGKDPATLSDEEKATLESLKGKLSEFNVESPAKLGDTGAAMGDIHYALTVAKVSGLISEQVSNDDINAGKFGESTQAATLALTKALEEQGITTAQEFEQKLPQLAKTLSDTYNRNIADYKRQVLAEEDKAQREESRVRDMMTALPDQMNPEAFFAALLMSLFAMAIGRPDLAKSIWDTFSAAPGGNNGLGGSPTWGGVAGGAVGNTAEVLAPKFSAGGDRVTGGHLADDALLATLSQSTGISIDALRKAADRSAAQLSTLHPAIQAAAVAGVKELWEAGLPVIVTEGYRSSEDQAGMVARGVSKAAPGNSFHNHALAFDIVPMTTSGQPTWNAPTSTWRSIQAKMETYGFFSGGKNWGWDEPHFQAFSGIAKVHALPIAAGSRDKIAEGIRVIPDSMIHPRWKEATEAWERANGRAPAPVVAEPTPVQPAAETSEAKPAEVVNPIILGLVNPEDYRGTTVAGAANDIPTSVEGAAATLKESGVAESKGAAADPTKGETVTADATPAKTEEKSGKTKDDAAAVSVA